MIGPYMGKCRLCGKDDQALNEGICAAHGDDCAQAYLFGFADGQAAPTSAQKDGVREALERIDECIVAKQYDLARGAIRAAKKQAALHATPASDGVGEREGR